MNSVRKKTPKEKQRTAKSRAAQRPSSSRISSKIIAQQRRFREFRAFREKIIIRERKTFHKNKKKK